MMKCFIRAVLCVLITAGLFACGGGGSSPPPIINTTTYSISGNVTSAGGALQGVTITLSGASSTSTSTDASGNFTIDGLANGSYIVTPSMTGFAFSPSSSAQTVNGANVTGVNFTATAISGSGSSLWDSLIWDADTWQ